MTQIGDEDEELTLGFAEVQRVVGHGHTESLAGINVSTCVVVTVGVFRIRAFLCRCDSGEEEEDSAERTK